MKSIFICDAESTVRSVYSPKTTEQIAAMTELDPTVYCKDDILASPEKFADTRYVFSTWGMPSFTKDEIARCLPDLECIFYGAGTVQGFARPFLESGVKVFSAWAANGVPVAEFTVAQIVLANKGYFAVARQEKLGGVSSAREAFSHYRGNFDRKIGIIGAGMIGKMVIRRLKDYRFDVLVFDPFLPDDMAAELGVEKCSLERLFSECDVVSNHLANNAQTKGMLDGKLFASMKPYSTFINTGRGAQVIEPELIAVLTERPDITALLDVTFPEPPVEGSPLYTLPNCILTPHIAGSAGDEVHRMAEYMAEEFRKYTAGESCLYEVTLKMLETMA